MASRKKGIHDTNLMRTGRYLGIEVRGRGFGFVVLEDRSVLDFGNRRCSGSAREEQVRRQIKRILEVFRPQVMVLRKLHGRKAGVNDAARKIRQVILQEARQRGITVEPVSSSAVLRCFERWNARKKYEISLAVAKLLPDLEWALPPKRRAWEAEHPRTPIFEAAASILGHLHERYPNRSA